MKPANASFRVIKINRVAAFIALVVLLALLFFPFDRLRDTALVNALPGLARVRHDVTLEGIALGGQPEAKARQAVADLATRVNRAPIDAQVDPNSRGRGVIPELGGLELDIDATLQKVMSAPAGSAVSAVFREIPAAKTLADFPTHVIYRGNPHKKQVAFVVNVAWGEPELAKILDILKEKNARASFFITGRWAAKLQNKPLIEEMVDRGYEIGNHSYSEPHLSRSSRTEISREITKTNDLLQTISGKPVAYFSAPFGEYSKLIAETAADHGMRTVYWTLDTVDWQSPPLDAMIKKIVEGAEPGAIVLMHPKPVTVDALAAMIEGVRAKGLELVTISELLSPSYVPPQPASTATSGGQ